MSEAQTMRFATQLVHVIDREAEEFKQTLAKLSGKSRKRGRPPTSGVLLSGVICG